MKIGGDGAGRLLLIPFAPGIGDMVMMEPLLRAVLKSLPEWQTTMAAKGYAADLLQPGSYEIVTPSYFVTEPPGYFRPFHRLLPQRIIAWAAEPAMSLDFGPFERVINLFWAWESRTPFDRWWTPQWPLLEGVVHAVDLLASYLEEELEALIPREERLPRLTVFDDAARWADGYLAGTEAGSRTRLAALIPVASDSLKWWEAGKWAEVNDQLAMNGWQTVLIAPPDHSHAQEMFDGCVTKPFWPRLTLRQLTAMLSRCSLAVGVDTGPLHIASALGLPWVGLFGATNPDLIGPYDRSQGRPIVARFPKAPSCAHCWLAFKNRDDRCLTLPATGCTTMLSVDDVLRAVDEVITGMLIAARTKPVAEASAIDSAA